MNLPALLTLRPSRTSCAQAELASDLCKLQYGHLKLAEGEQIFRNTSPFIASIQCDLVRAVNGSWLILLHFGVGA